MGLQGPFYNIAQPFLCGFILIAQKDAIGHKRKVLWFV